MLSSFGKRRIIRPGLRIYWMNKIAEAVGEIIPMIRFIVFMMINFFIICRIDNHISMSITEEGSSEDFIYIRF